MRGAQPEPPRHGEGDRPAQPGGGGVGAAPRATILKARRERRSGNPAEVRLWQALRARPGGFRFRRQHPVGPFVLDFACLGTRIAIEVDGEIHERGERPGRDAARDAALAEVGFLTLRFAARDVFGNSDVVVTAIVAACRERAPLHHDAVRRGPPPRPGEV